MRSDHRYNEHWYKQEHLRLRCEADAAWDVAEEASMKAGNPFKDRHGDFKYPTPKRICMLQRVLDEVQRQIKAGVMQWPEP